LGEREPVAERPADVAIVTVSYNTCTLLAETLGSAFEGLSRSGLDGQVWVVDNASSDGSAEMVRQRFPAVHLIAHEKNQGFAGANNLALRAIDRQPAIRPRHVLFLNPDTRILGDALGQMARFLDATPHAGVAGARLVHGDGSFQHAAFRFPGLWQILLDFFPVHHRLVNSRLNGRYPRRLYESGRPFRVDHPLGAALMVRTAALQLVGGFDEQFFMYCEEIDLCRRIKSAGWEAYCVPAATIVHLVAQSTRQFREQMFVALWRSRFRMFRKHNSSAFRWAARRLLRLGLWAEGRRAEAACRRGELGDAQLKAWLAAYREVAAL
jgi:N-acetylglucosaminyl-diphospho-decaprenol L-rhamnosyltransferase